MDSSNDLINTGITNFILENLETPTKTRHSAMRTALSYRCGVDQRRTAGIVWKQPGAYICLAYMRFQMTQMLIDFTCFRFNIHEGWRHHKAIYYHDSYLTSKYFTTILKKFRLR